jgi:Ras GTPase-activating-like protein IQGAP2/3
MHRRPNIYFNITSPTPGTFIIALHYKGREKAILEMDLNIDDLLEKVRVYVYIYPLLELGLTSVHGR